MILVHGIQINNNSNSAVDMVDHHVYRLPQFQDILDKSVKKGNFGDFMSIMMNLRERPLTCLGQY